MPAVAIAACWRGSNWRLDYGHVAASGQPSATSYQVLLNLRDSGPGTPHTQSAISMADGHSMPLAWGSRSVSL